MLAASCVDIVGPDTVPSNLPSDTTSKAGAAGTPPSDTSFLRIVVSTSGVDLDPDGYTLRLIPAPDARSLVLRANGSVDIALPEGSYVVTLGDVAPNCAIAPQGWLGTTARVQMPRRPVTKPAVQAAFAVACAPIPTARLDDGTQLAFVRDGQIWRVNSDGSDPVRLSAGPADDHPAWSPDGRRIAFSRREGSADQPRTTIHVMDADGSNVVRLMESYGADPTWSPDGRRIAFASTCAGQGCVLIASLDPNETTPIRVGWPQGVHDSPAWSPDGTRIAFTSDWVAFDFVSDVYVATLADGKIDQLTATFRMWDDGPIRRYEQPAWSPDSRRLAVIGCPQSYFLCDTSGLAVMNADGSGEVQLPAPRAGAPTWSPDGRTIAFAVGGSPQTAGSIQWMRADGTARGTIVADGHSPAWRPSP